MSRRYIALGSPEKFVKLGDFNVKVRDLSINVYYNMDLGRNWTKMFDLNIGLERNVELAHQSFHSSGKSHTKVEEKGAKLNKTPLILGIESFHFDVAPKEQSAYDLNTVFLSPSNGVKRYLF